MHAIRALLAACFLTVGLSARAQQVRTPNFTRARAVMDSVLRTNSIPSIAVAVAHGDAILWEAAIGFADVERRNPATPHTPYSLASISKPFTATAIMLLAQRELVRLRAPVNHYLGGAHITAREGTADGVTIERLLTHTAGLPLHYQFFYEDESDRRPPMDSTIKRYGVAVFGPGEAYQYSNLGYGILDYVIARKSGVSYAEFMRREVFVPLRLTNTSVGLPPGVAGRPAQRYDADNQLIAYYTFDHPGASEVYSSAHDLVRFGMFHLGARLPGQRPILPRETLQDMQRDVASEGATGGATRGLGWGIRTVHGVRRVSHGGGMPGVSTSLVLYPEEKVAIVVLLNKGVPTATEAIVNELSAAMIPRIATGLRAVRAAGANPVTPPSDSAQLEQLYGEWRGFIYTYADSVPVVVRFGSASRVSLYGDEVPFTNVVMRNGIVTGAASIQLRAPDLARREHRTTLWLRHQGGRLTGYAAAQTTTRRGYYALSSYIRLERLTR